MVDVPPPRRAGVSDHGFDLNPADALRPENAVEANGVGSSSMIDPNVDDG